MKTKKVIVVKCQNCNKGKAKNEVSEVGNGLSDDVSITIKAVCPFCKDRPEGHLVWR